MRKGGKIVVRIGGSINANMKFHPEHCLSVPGTDFCSKSQPFRKKSKTKKVKRFTYSCPQRSGLIAPGRVTIPPLLMYRRPVEDGRDERTGEGTSFRYQNQVVIVIWPRCGDFLQETTKFFAETL